MFDTMLEAWLLAIVVIIVITSWGMIFPENAYKYRSTAASIYLGLIIGLFGYIAIGYYDEDYDMFWMIIPVIAFSLMFMWGYNPLRAKTFTNVYSKVTEKPVGDLEPGGFLNNFIDPIAFRTGTTGKHEDDGHTIDTSQFSFEGKTAEMQTRNRGVLVSYTYEVPVELIEDDNSIAKINNFKGGFAGMRERMAASVFAGFKDISARYTALEIDESSNSDEFCTELAAVIQAKFNRQGIPYRVLDPIIEDTVLPDAFYDKLELAYYQALDEDRKDETVKRFKVRVEAAGYSLKDKGVVEVLKIMEGALDVKKNINEVRIDANSDIGRILAEVIAEIKK